MTKQRRFDVVRAMASAAALAAAFIATPATGAYDDPQRFAMAGAPLDESLKEFSEQTGVSVVYDHRLVSGRQAPPLRGSLSPREALRALLDGSPLGFREIDGRTVAIIEAAPAIEYMPALTKQENLLDGEDSRIDEIIVTSSYRAPGFSTGAKVGYELDAEALEMSGAQNVAEPIHELPTTVASISSANTQLLISAGGLNLADMRGLGADRSLVLVNGRRFVRTTGGGRGLYGVDLNAIPTSLIDRVEVINQGSGASLGPEAVGGAINFVMRDHIDGVSLGAHGGISERGDAGEYTLTGFAGTRFDNGRGKLSGGVVYAMDPSLFFTDRDYLSLPFGFARDGRQATPTDGDFLPGFGASIFTAEGFVAGAVTQSGQTVLNFSDTARQVLTEDGFEPFEGRLDQLYNWVEGFNALPKIDRLHGYSRVDWEASDALELYGEMFFADVDTETQIAAAPISAFRGGNIFYGDSIVVPADHPDAPAGLRAQVESSLGAPIESFLVNRRFVELGPRRREIARRTLDLHLGMNADIGADWSLRASYGFGRNRVRDDSFNLADGNRVSIAADPDLCAATPGCVPFNVFNGGAVDPASQAFYRAPTRERRLTTLEHTARIVVAGPIYDLAEETGLLSVGGEFRRNAYHDTPISDMDDVAAPFAEFDMPGVDGAVNYGDLFFNAELPLADATAPLGMFRLGVDGRATTWSGGGFVANISGDLVWRPIRGLELYGFALLGGRPPNVVELFSRGPNTAGLLFDPCAAPGEQPFIDNCASPGPLGVPAGFVQNANLVPRVVTSNVNLDAEDVHTRHFGVAIDIDALADLGDSALRLTADWRYHRVRNAISGADANAIFFDCYFSVDLSSRFCGNNPGTNNRFIQRDADGNLTAIEVTAFNSGVARASGLDATLAFTTDLLQAPGAPTLSFDVLYSYVDQINLLGPYNDSVFEDQAGRADFPKHQLYSTASLEFEWVKTQWTVRRRGEARTNKFFEIPATRLPPTTYVDAGLQFRPSDQVIVYGGVENIFDKRLPIAAFAENGFFAEFYDPIGRRYFAGVRAEF